MKINQFLFLVIIILLLSCNTNKNIEPNKEQVSIVIQQLLVKPEYIFSIQQSKFKILENRYSYKKNASKVKQINRYSAQLNTKELLTISHKIKGLNNLKEQYSKPVIGGIVWQIDYSINGEQKSITLDNYLPNEVKKLFQIINSLIENGKPQLTIL